MACNLACQRPDLFRRIIHRPGAPHSIATQVTGARSVTNVAGTTTQNSHCPAAMRASATFASSSAPRVWLATIRLFGHSFGGTVRRRATSGRAHLAGPRF
jgi:hypothetical protein